MGKTIGRRALTVSFLFGCTVALAGVFAVAAPERAHAADTSVAKWLCLGTPGTPNTSTATCPAPGVASVPAAQPVYYVISVANGTTGSIPVTLNDTYPPNFTGGTAICTDNNGVTVYGPALALSSFSAPVTVPPQTGGVAGSVTCTIGGVFRELSNQVTNSVTNTDSGGAVTFPFDSVVTGPTPLNADLSINKTASPQYVDVSAGPATVTYTITIRNNGPDHVMIGPFFTLHDTFALMPSSVPLNVTLLAGSQNCAHYDVNGNLITAGDCLVPTTQIGSPPVMVATSAAQAFADWNFGTQLGYMAPGDYLVLTYKVEISRVPWITCVKAPNSDGLRNNAFFDLKLVDGTTFTELDPSNNTSNANPPINSSVNPPHNTDSDVDVFTGYYVADPACATPVGPPPPLNIKKVQIAPSAGIGPPWTSWAPWNSFFFYDITIQNMSSTQTISDIRFSDIIQEGLGTPPFTESNITMLSGGCLGTAAPDHNFTYYTEQYQAWNPPAAGSGFTLGPGGIKTCRIRVMYSAPSCTSVPVISPLFVINIARIQYTSADLNGNGSYAFDQQAWAATRMDQPPKCKFVVTKTLVSGGPNVHFDGPPGPNAAPLVYTVTFQNQDPVPRVVGTLIDAVRLTVPNYATSLPYNASYSCTLNAGVDAIAFGPLTGAVTGNAVYTASPAQGARIINKGPVTFQSVGMATCTVTIWVHPPPASNPFCYAKPPNPPWADWENAALMDVSTTYNPNLPWPPTTSPWNYVQTNPSNPSSQTTNWATVRTPLPQCYNFLLSKFASNPNISPPAWTSAPNVVPPVNYTITVTNVGPAAIPSGGGVNVTDLPPTPNGTLTPAPHTDNVTTLAANAQWTMTPNPSLTGPLPVSSSIYNINNCVELQATGVLAGPDWYAAWDPTAQGPAPVKKKCVDVPVVPTSTLTVTKIVKNQTGSSISIPSLSFGVVVTCTPYSLPPASTTLTTSAGSLANGQSTSSSAWVIPNVPVADDCTVTEPTLPPVPAGACPGGTAYWDTSITPTPINISANASNNNVTVRNTLRCEMPTPPPCCGCDEWLCQCVFQYTADHCITVGQLLWLAVISLLAMILGALMCICRLLLNAMRRSGIDRG